MPRVLMTGAFGYLGLALLAGLREVSIVAMGHAPRTQAAERLMAKVESVVGDVAAVRDVITSRGPFDAVVHLAGGGGPTKLASDSMGAVRSNLRATSELLARARCAGIPRLLYASTIAVYGTHRDHGRPYAESDEVRPDDIYGVVKEAAEHTWTALGGGTSLRLANIYGAGSRVDTGLMGAVERFARAAAAGGELTIFGEGLQRVDYVHVDDVVRAFQAALSAKEPPSVVNIGGGSPIGIKALAELAIAAGRGLGRAPRLVQQPAPEGKSWPDRSLAIDRAKQVLGWEPRVGYEDGVRDLVHMMAGR